MSRFHLGVKFCIITLKAGINTCVKKAICILHVEVRIEISFVKYITCKYHRPAVNTSDAQLIWIHCVILCQAAACVVVFMHYLYFLLLSF
jgi:hypothetical protein